MRVSEQDRETIRRTAEALFGPGTKVRVFGSRLNDGLRGGDIDLYVETDQLLENRASSASRLAAELQIALGDQRIDVVLVDPSTPRKSIHKIAQSSGALV